MKALSVPGWTMISTATSPQFARWAPDPRRALREPVSVNGRTGLRPAEMEIEKWRAETGARIPPRRTFAILAGQQPVELTPTRLVAIFQESAARLAGAAAAPRICACLTPRKSIRTWQASRATPGQGSFLRSQHELAAIYRVGVVTSSLENSADRAQTSGIVRAPIPSANAGWKIWLITRQSNRSGFTPRF
jgi:hypothetical protein